MKKPQTVFREYYKQSLEQLPATTGINQLRGMTKDQITHLLDTLEQVSRRFATVIPYPQQKTLLSKAMLQDQEFYGLNARWVYKHLSTYLQQNPHLRNAYHQQQESEAERERRNQEFLKANPGWDRQKAIEQFKKQIDSVGQVTKPAPKPKSVAAGYYKK